nr:RNA-directed DNA polymerase homolog [Tanacetum cinerariifolium]
DTIFGYRSSNDRLIQQKDNAKVGDDEVIFDVDQSIKRPPIDDDECYKIDDLNDTINAKAQELLANDEPDSFLSRGLEKSIDQSDLDECEPVECNTNNDSDKSIQSQKDHFPLPFIDQMLERICENEYYCFLDGFSGFFQILIAPEDQEKTTFTCPYETFAYRRMPFALCNALATFQRCMTAIFHDMVEDFMEVFMDDFSVF